MKKERENMIEKLRSVTNKKMFHLVMIIIIIAVILFFFGITVLRYSVEGEKNMPFVLTKISVISQVDGKEKEAVDSANRWAFDVLENNDIYLYIDKNDNYDKEETIKTVTVSDMQLTQAPKLGSSKFYRPDATTENVVFSNTDEYLCDSIQYVGDVNTDIKNTKISNQGGIVVFRYAVENIATYEGNDEEIQHNQLLSKAGTAIDDIKSVLEFDLSILLDSGKEFQTRISLELPIDDVVSQGVTSMEFTDVQKYVFKRVQN